ncbi:IclR family transcriptional regulator [Catenulispora rubra]|uniref:IclR family transcriptional regulator n=1 Tax=Catenulispora rubra TaxID=280293 RepID=UPI001E5DD05D|nr:helix-turn-helix domain-containing protein [Catenulispora rubra]
MPESNAAASPKGREGNQTLARGLSVLLAIADSKRGLSVQQASELLGVHRSIAYRLLETLADFGLVARNREGVYNPGARLATLAEAYLPTLRDVSRPVMQSLAEKLQSTVSLFVEQGGEAVAIVLVEPTTASHHIAFAPGMRTPLDLGAAAYAILASGPAGPDEPAAVETARELGYARSHGEIEAGAYGVAAWIPTGDTAVRACLNLITYRQDIADGAGPVMRDAADEVGRLLRRP